MNSTANSGISGHTMELKTLALLLLQCTVSYTCLCCVGIEDGILNT